MDNNIKRLDKENIDLQLLIWGKESYYEILNWIESAKESIEIWMFLWRDDIIGNQIWQKLVDALNDIKRPNLKIKITKDWLWSLLEHSEK